MCLEWPATLRPNPVAKLEHVDSIVPAALSAAGPGTVRMSREGVLYGRVTRVLDDFRKGIVLLYVSNGVVPAQSPHFLRVVPTIYLAPPESCPVTLPDGRRWRMQAGHISNGASKGAANRRARRQ